MNILGFEISRSQVVDATKPIVKDSTLMTSSRFLLVLGFLAVVWFAKGIFTDPILLITTGAVLITYLITNTWSKIAIARLNADYHTTKCSSCHPCARQGPCESGENGQPPYQDTPKGVAK